MVSLIMDTVTSTICKQGLLKKVKPRLRSKYFVVHKDDMEMPARVEYYDNIKQFDSKKKPKKTLYLRTCFSVNVFTNKAVKCGMVLYTKDDSFPIAFDNEEDRDSWLMTIKALINVHRDARPLFEHVWNVKIRERGLGKPFVGDYRLCLNDRTVMFVKKAAVDPEFVFPLEVIRRCGHSDNFFNFEVGRQASTGPGEFWMEVDDGLIAENVHQAIIAVMNKPKENEDSFRSESSGNSRSTFDARSGSLSGETSSRAKRQMSTRPKPNPMAKHRGRSDSNTSRTSRTSRTTTATASTIVVGGGSTIDISGGGPSRSVDNLSISASSVSAGTADTLTTSLPDSRSSTPVRSLTPDPRLAILNVLESSPEQTSDAVNYIPMDMSPLAYNSTHLRDERSNSHSSSSISSRDLLPTASSAYADQLAVEQTPYADMTVGNGSLAVKPTLTNLAAVLTDDGSYADMGPVNVPAPDKPILDQPTPPLVVDDGSYADMAPLNPHNSKSATPTFSLTDDKNSSYAEMGPVNTAFSLTALAVPEPASVDAASYLSMSPSSSSILTSQTTSKRAEKSQSYVAKDEEQDSPYLAQVPYLAMEPARLPSRGAGGLSDSLYLDMAPTGAAGVSSASSAPINDPPYLDMAPGVAVSVSGSAVAKPNYSPYLDMTPINSNGKEAGTTTRPLSATPYMEMSRTGSSDSVAHARANSLQLSVGALEDVTNPYIDMSGRDALGALHNKDARRRMDSIRSYLSSNENVMEDVPLRHYSVGSRPTALQRPPNPDQYVDMCQSRDFPGKSLSVPHLMPLSVASNPDLTRRQEDCGTSSPSQKQRDSLMMLNFDRQMGETFKQRPRVSTWSNSIRPRSSSHGQKQHQIGSTSNSSRESVQSAVSDYVDMQAGTSGAYVEMGNRDHHSHHHRPNSANRYNRKSSHPFTGVLDSGNKLLSKLSPPKSTTGSSNARGGVLSSGIGVAAAKSNSFDTLSDRSTTNPSGGEYGGGGFLPDDILRNPQLGLIGRRMSQPHQTIEPFPELSASSEEEIGMRSAASSFSSRSSSSSRGDNSGTLKNAAAQKNTHSLYGGGAQLDPESYLECQQVPLRGGSSASSHSIHSPHSSAAKSKKPTRVASFISEEPTSPTPSPKSVLTAKAEKKDRKSKSRKSEGITAGVVGSENKQMSKFSRALHSIKLPQPLQSGAVSKPALPNPPLTADMRNEQKRLPLSNHNVQSKPSANSTAAGTELHTQLSSSQLFSTSPQSASQQPSATFTHHIVTSPPRPLSQSSNIPQNTKGLSADVSGSSQPYSRPQPNNHAPVVEPYVEMAPISPLQWTAGGSVTAPTHPIPPLVDECDNYTVMAPLAKDSSLQTSPGLHLIKPLPVIDKLELVSDAETASETSTDVTNLSSAPAAGTGSSSDSNHTLQLEDPEPKISPQQVYPQVSITAKRTKGPKSVPCYIRQNSKDSHIYPRPDIPAPCYIRSESNLSQSSEQGINDDLLDSLADADMGPFCESNFYHNNSMVAAFSGLRRGPTDPISPIRLSSITPDSVKLPNTPGYPRSFSEVSTSSSTGTDIPSSAAELERQISNKKQLDLVQEEEGSKESTSRDGGGGSSGGSSKEGGFAGREACAKTVKSYILDDTKAVASKSRGIKSSVAPLLAVRLVNDEERPSGGRHTSSSDPSPATPEPLNYVDIKHDKVTTVVNTSGGSSGNAVAGSAATTNNQSSSPKSTDSNSSAPQMVGNPSCQVNYVKIDHKKTQDLGKKGSVSISH